MNTRKQFLRDGFGLAAILSSQTAPAILVRSMAAARYGIVMGRKRLPYDAEVEYIESTSGGGQWIDTNYLFTSNNTKVEALFYSTQITGQVLFGAEVSTQRTLTPLLYVDGTNKFSVFIARSPRAIRGVDATAGLYSVTIESNSTGQVDFNYNGTVYSGTFTGDVYRDLPISLFAERFPTKIDFYSKNLKFYSFKIWDNNILVRDFIPVRIGTEGAMYDRVSKQLFRNQGTGEFLYGGDVYSVPVETGQYVHDGLIAMWDGKENAGVGLHSPNTTTWKDLTGNHVLSYEFTPSFTDNAFELPGTDKVAYCESNLWRDAVNTNQCTVEMCFKGYSFGGNNSIIALGRGTSSNVERAWWQWGNVAFGYRLSTGSTWSNDTLLPRGETDDVSLSFPLANMYRNGTRVMTGSPGTLNIQSNTLVIGRIGTFKSTINGFATMRADIHSIRIYNKVLTAAEIAANSAVDKARFNLKWAV